MRLLDRLVVGVYMVLAALPVIAMLRGWRDHRLEGAVAAPPRPALSLAAVRSEDYQGKFAAWFDVEHGLRSWEIWIDNTLLYHGFSDTRFGSRVVVGDGGVMFEQDDLGYFNRSLGDLPPPGAFDSLAGRIAALQRRIARDGRALVPMLLPSKTTIYADAVPAEWSRPLGNPRPSTERVYLAMKRALDAHQVAYVDGIALLQARPEPRDVLWGASARHFSSYAACLCTHEVMRRYAELTGRPAFDYPCQVELQKADRRQRDLDLFLLLNTWRVRHDLVQRVSRHDPLPADRPPGAPSVLWIASSFGWVTMDDAAGSRRFGQLHLDYYHSSVHPQGSYWQFSAAEHDATWRDVFLTRDVYVLELLETYAVPGYFGDAAVDAISAELGP